MATRNISAVPATITQSSLINAIKSAFEANSNFTTIVDDYTSGTDRILVIRFTVDAAKSRGSVFLRIRCTSSLQLAQQIFSSWDANSKTGANGSSESVYTALSSTTQITINSLFSSNEFHFLFLVQSTTIISLGVLAPKEKPDWWNLNTWNYGFYSTDLTLTTLRGTTLNPYANTDYTTSLNNARLASANSVTSERDGMPGIFLFTNSNQGIAGKTSDDLAAMANSGATRYQSTSGYLIVTTSAGGLGIKI